MSLSPRYKLGLDEILAPIGAWRHRFSPASIRVVPRVLES
jgi:hypothetical protein